jgi:hypothetical protein
LRVKRCNGTHVISRYIYITENYRRGPLAGGGKSKQSNREGHAQPRFELPKIRSKAKERENERREKEEPLNIQSLKKNKPR